MSAVFRPNPLLAAQVGLACERALRGAAEALLSESQDEVPVETADLRDSGVVSVDGTRAAVAYTDWKAQPVHERMNARHPDGKAKFLEDPLNRMRRELLDTIGDDLRRSIGR